MSAGSPVGRNGDQDDDFDAPSGTPTQVLLIDDHEMFTSSLAVVLDAEPDMRVVATAASAEEGVRKAADTGAEVVLLDQRLPDGDGVALIPRLLRLDPSPKVVMLTASTLDRVLVAAIEAGAAGFIDKSRAVSEVIAAIRSAAAGESLISPAMLARLLPRLRRQESDPAWTITEREREVLGFLAQGMSNAEIAEQLTVSVHTVRNHVTKLSAKLGAHSKLEVLSIAVRKGLVAV